MATNELPVRRALQPPEGLPFCEQCQHHHYDRRGHVDYDRADLEPCGRFSIRLFRLRMERLHGATLDWWRAKRASVTEREFSLNRQD